MSKTADRIAFELENLSATDRLAKALADNISDQAIIALNGPLGTGKTRLVQGVARALGVEEVVNSPTFTMMNEYHSGRLPLYHFDLYRLSEPGNTPRIIAPVLDLELQELLAGPGIFMIEWAELLENPELTSEVSSPTSTNFLSQLDHLVARLSYNETIKEKVTPPQIDLYKEGEGRKIVFCPSGTQSNLLLRNLSKGIRDMVVSS
jgi:tRNA threonylcarbamoyladenosine biosynthesis protein TsaE